MRANLAATARDQSAVFAKPGFYAFNACTDCAHFALETL
jgi:hypothetical protein